MEMAIYHLSAQVISRSAGRSAVAAAAYRSAEKLEDAYLGKTYDFSKKKGVEHKEILAPERAPTWVHDREKLWNAVEAAEKRKDAQLAREVRVALPNELSSEDQKALVRAYCQEQFVERGMVVDVAIHRDDPNNPHAHILLTTRSISEDGFGPKDRSWNDKSLLMEWRSEWAHSVNRSLERAGLDQRVEHRSFSDQGIDLEPTIKIGSEREGDDRFVIQERLEKHEAIVRRNGEAIRENPDLALDAITRERATFTKQDVARWLGPRTVDADQFQACLSRVMGSGLIVELGKDSRGQERFSTREMLETERGMMASSEVLAEQRTHKVRRDRVSLVLEGRELNTEQRHALRYLTEKSGDIAVIQGYAGTGKSYLLGAAREAWEGEGYRVLGAALSGKAAEGLEVSSGISSRSLASREYAWDRGREGLTKNDILVIDEAAMIGTRQMNRVLEHAEKAGAKVVLVGDTAQLQAIEAGAPMRAIAGQVGQAQLSEIVRQESTPHQTASRRLAEGDVARGLLTYQQEDRVHGHATKDDAIRTMLGDWDAHRKAHPEQTQIMLAYTRNEVQLLNEGARACLKADGTLGEDRTMQTARGQRDFAIGDRVYFLQNDRDLGVKNGTLGTIQLHERGVMNIQTDEGRRVVFRTDDYNHIDHGYAATLYKAQGASVDRCSVLASEYFDRHGTYVAMTRHRKEVDLHYSREDFQNEGKLIETLERARPKDMVLDYAEVHDVNVAFDRERRADVPSRSPVVDAPEQRPAELGERHDRPRTLEERFEAMSPEEIRKTYRDLDQIVRQGMTNQRDVFESLEPVKAAKSEYERADFQHQQARLYRERFEAEHPIQAALAKTGLGKNAELYQAEKATGLTADRAHASYARVLEDPTLQKRAADLTRAHNDRFMEARDGRARCEPFYQRAEREFERRLEERAKEFAQERTRSRELDKGKGWER